MNTVVASNNKALEEKLFRLIAEKEEGLGVSVLCQSKAANGNVHFLCRRLVDESFIVWTSYCTGDATTTYENFYNGFYDATLREAMDEMDRRVGIN